MAADIDHRIDRGGTADDLAAGALERAPAGRRLGLGEIHPIVHPPLQQPWPAERDVDPRIAVPATRLKQQHARVLVLAQPIRQSAAGRAGSDDDVSVFRILTGGPNGRLLCCG
jgi:hypothetical protein